MHKLKIDAAVFTAVAQNYIAKPIFSGIEDPLPKRSGFLKGETDTVTLPDIPLRKPKPVLLESRKGTCPPLTYEAFEKIIEWMADQAPEKGRRNQYWGAMAGFLCRAGIPPDDISDMIYEAASVNNDEEAKSRAGCALRACDAIGRGQSMTGIPTLEEEFNVEKIDEIKKLIGTITVNLDDLIKALTPKSSQQDIVAVLREIKGMQPIPQEQHLQMVKAQTGMAMGPLRKQLDLTPLSDDPVSAHDTGMQVAYETLQMHYENGQDLIRIDKRNFSYNGTHWEDEPDDYIAGRVLPFANACLTRGNDSVNDVVRDAASLIKWQSAKKGDAMRLQQDPYPIINTPDAEVWLHEDGTHETLPHNRDSFLLSCLNVRYDPAATCPRFDKAVLEILAETSDPADVQRHLYEFMGYVMQPRKDIAVFGLWSGGSNCGKSKLGETLTRLVGDNAVLHMKLQAFHDDKDALGNLPGKLMVVDDDLDQGVYLPDGIVKKISERKKLTGELKYVNKFSFISHATLLMIGNHWPKVKIFDPAIERRALVFPFDRTFTREEDDKTLFPSIWADSKEMSGILNRCIEGYKRVRERKQFQIPESCREAYLDWIADCDFVGQFINEICERREYGPHQFWHEHFTRFLEHARKNEKEVYWTSQSLKARYEALGYKFSTTSGKATIVGLYAPGTTEYW